MNSNGKSALAVGLALCVFVASTATGLAQGPCAVFRTWATGDSLTAADLNTSFSTVGVTNMEFSCLDDLSGSVTEMRGTTTPFTTTESLATTGAGEIERLRYMWLHVMGYSRDGGGFWYDHWRNLQIGDRMVNAHRGVSASAGEGLYRGQMTFGAAAVRYHAVAFGFESQAAHPESALALIHVGGTPRFMVGLGGDLHALSTMATGAGTARFPAYFTHRFHGSGLWFPAQDHVSVSAGGDAPYRFHAAGFATHAVLFMHAASGTWTALTAHATSSARTTYILPQAGGSDNQVLKFRTGGVLAWEADNTSATDIGARVFNSTAISIANNTTTALTFDSERWDTDAIHSTVTNTSRLTVQTAGKYLIVANVSFAANGTGQRQLRIVLNGTTIIGLVSTVANSGTAATRVVASTIYDLSATNYIEAVVLQDSGGALNVEFEANLTPEFMTQKIG